VTPTLLRAEGLTGAALLADPDVKRLYLGG